jgi:hypothetical protein
MIQLLCDSIGSPGKDQVYEKLIDIYGMRELLVNDTAFGMNRVELFYLYGEFAFVGFIVLMALLLEDLWRKR